MGPCIAGGAYLPALSDVIIMVEGTSFMGLGGPNLVKGATGQVVDAESLGGARLHTAVSGVAHYMAKDDAECLACIRQRFRASARAAREPAGTRTGPRHRQISTASLPADHRLPYEIEEIILRIFDRRRLSRISARVRARDAVRERPAGGPPGGADRQPARIPESGGPPRIGGIVYTESARKVAYFVETGERLGLPLIYLQDVSGFMVGPEAEREGIIRAGAEMVEIDGVRRRCRRSCSRSTTPAARATTRWPARASIRTSRSAGRPRGSA